MAKATSNYGEHKNTQFTNDIYQILLINRKTLFIRIYLTYYM